MLRMLFLAASAQALGESFTVSVYDSRWTNTPDTIHAASGWFETGLPGPATKCPLSDPTGCPPVYGTLVTRNMGALSVSVAGGQGIYIQPDGKVTYGKPHQSLPLDGIVNGWHHKVTASGRDVVDYDDGNGHKGLVLCPQGASTKALYARTPNFHLYGCIEIEGLCLTESEHSNGAFQYE
ncbi:hypothetical protein F4802DRAFT_620385 [Xylaria palmicola]|nr:hypothetical protein F4802DRAFT_620385 [Xylaria palmicola]